MYSLIAIWAVLPLSFGLMYLEMGLVGTIAGLGGMLSFLPLHYLIGKTMVGIRCVFGRVVSVYK